MTEAPMTADGPDAGAADVPRGRAEGQERDRGRDRRSTLLLGDRGTLAV